MFTRFTNPLHQLSHATHSVKANDKTASFNRAFRHIIYTGLLTGGFLLSGYNFIKNRTVQPSAGSAKQEEKIDEDKNLQTISVISYVNFDARETLHSDEPAKPAIIETPHLNKPETIGEQTDNALIRGRLCDENGNKVKSADILLYKAGELVAVTYSGENGEFSFENMPAASYALKILRVGYVELDYPEFELASGRTGFLDICIESTEFGSTRNNVKRTLTPSSTKMLDNQDFKGRLALTITIKNPAPIDR